MTPHDLTCNALTDSQGLGHVHGGRVACEGEQGGDDMHENVGANLDDVCLELEHCWTLVPRWGPRRWSGLSQKARLSVENEDYNLEVVAKL